MSKKLIVLSILFGLVCIIVFRWGESSKASVNKSMVMSTTFNEQKGYDQFVKQLPKKALNEMNWATPFYLKNGGLPRLILNCKAYIKVDKILVQQKKPEDEQVTAPAEQPNVDAQVKHKRIAITFDDGPHAKVTDQILSILQKYDVKATFFVIGLNVVQHPDIVAKANEHGHEIANHSWSHKNLTKLTPEQLHTEIDQTNEAINEAIGKYPTAYRPPFGATNADVRKEIALTSVLWNIDTMDWHHKTPAKTLANVKAQAKDGGILLMHDIYQESADALESVIIYLKKEGYEFVKISEIEQ